MCTIFGWGEKREAEKIPRADMELRMRSEMCAFSFQLNKKKLGVDCEMWDVEKREMSKKEELIRFTDKEVVNPAAIEIRVAYHAFYF